jgi:hypothetical protein
MERHKNSRVDLTAEFVRQVFSYDPLTGILMWKSPFHSKSIGKPAGCINKLGYVQVRIKNTDYYVHRIIWLYMTGVWPEREVDHDDMNRANNVWKNLRLATSSENGYNRPAQKNNTSGFKGVVRHQGKWMARIKHAGKGIYLGIFSTPEEASQAYDEAAKRIAGPFSRL